LSYPTDQPVGGAASSAEVVVLITSLSLGQSPRLIPEDVDHARMLAEVNQVLPPIIVHAETRVVIDGRHRVLAARLRGELSIRARLFHGTSDEAYLVGVHSNTAHGKPLSLAERLRAASRILESRPDLSDRAIAGVCGLSPRTIGARRKANPRSDSARRVGADGRTRPLSSRLARQQAAELILAFPDDSNRRIGRSVGISEGTVRDVRRQIDRAEGSPPIDGDKPANPSPVGHPIPHPPQSPTRSALREKTASNGLQFGKWLVAHSVSEASWVDLVGDIPISQCPKLILDATAISDSWRALATVLERRMHGDAS
jgi:ParB-like chromosome segregation protein Spo0J